MLNITRTPGQQIRIADDMLLTLESIPGGEYALVRIEAPQLWEGPRTAKLEPGDRHLIVELVGLTLTDIQRGEARFAIDAPREIPVFREEIYQQRRRRRRRKDEDDRG